MVVRQQARGMEPMTMGLLQQEWANLAADWGTREVWAVQLMLLLRDEAKDME